MIFVKYILFGLLLISCVKQLPSTSATADESQGSYSETQHCGTRFPSNFYVSTGTTIPSSGAGPTSQIGALYVDGDGGRLRMDQFLLDKQYTFITDDVRKRAYVFERGPASKEVSNLNCRVFITRGRVTPLCVPREYERDADPYIVRGVPVTRFTGYDRSDGALLQIDYYVLNTSFTGHASTATNNRSTYSFSTIPWRLHTRFTPGAELKRIAGSPLTMPNWRFFGSPMFDEVAVPDDPAVRESTGSDVQLWVSDYDAMTVDFYNFVPLPPPPSVFAVPEECAMTEAAWDYSEADTSAPSCQAEAETLMLPVAQRFLIDWSFLLAQQQ